ncbi:LAFE_0F02080g1_1 [Lachancea fermentati]|uniref:LAFE_0F02080g1_1 n=1 Tax=Lachancea fermentati TaxID=4955 RepID=A0A1G4MEN4_LACFM|nr:LAFE_0F02080g1_1 [Lachancea fermentati]
MTHEKFSLLLIHPAVTTTPEVVENVKRGNILADSGVLDQFLINKLNDGSVTLEKDKYDVIYYLTPEKREEIKFPSKLIPELHAALRTAGKFYGLSDAYKVDALVNGFDIKDSNEGYLWVKKEQQKAAPVALKLNRSSTGGGGNALPSFKRASKALPTFQKAPGSPLPLFKRADSPVVAIAEDDLDDLDDEDDSDEIAAAKSRFFDDVGEQDSSESIDEDDLVEDGQNAEITLVTCEKTKTRRRKACKDCSCGLKEQEEQEMDALRNAQDRVLGNAVKFDEQELTEVDFTIQGKKVGGCGSCALGDAFRCSGCPYLGLPAFKPGQPINLNSISDDL